MSLCDRCHAISSDRSSDCDALLCHALNAITHSDIDRDKSGAPLQHCSLPEWKDAVGGYIPRGQWLNPKHADVPLNHCDNISTTSKRPPGMYVFFCASKLEHLLSLRYAWSVWPQSLKLPQNAQLARSRSRKPPCAFETSAD